MLHCNFDDGEPEEKETNRRFLIMPFGPCAPLVREAPKKMQL